MVTIKLQNGNYLMADKIKYIENKYDHRTVPIGDPIIPDKVGIQFDPVPVEKCIKHGDIIAWIGNLVYILGSYDLNEDETEDNNHVKDILDDLINHISTNRDYQMPENETIGGTENDYR